MRKPSQSLNGFHCETFNSEKCATVHGPTHSAIAPFAGACFRSFTISTGCAAPFTYNHALVPITCILTFVHCPATRSTYDS